ncbi:ubiquitin, putative [Entamoeba histolytica HM-3:IMSS]|uniref:Ubiquitin, putative n=1 Tax=Entamoeba histolytica HM-3:IMSS TaxID=885315 RepID=M7WUE3_ENTHI|nr:ubiquitin, putative [Entamoeba histolytica HM-3:IMSS]
MSCCSNILGMFSFVLFNNFGEMQHIEEQERETIGYENNYIIKVPENEKEFIEEYDNLIKEIDTQRQNNEECLAKE